MPPTRVGRPQIKTGPHLRDWLGPSGPIKIVTPHCGSVTGAGHEPTWIQQTQRGYLEGLLAERAMSSKRGFVKRRGPTWTAYWKVDTTTGLKQRTKGGFATRREAQAFLAETVAGLQTGRFTEPSKLTLADYLLNRWIPGRAGSLRPSTLDSYRRLIERRLVPSLGHVRLQHLSPDHLDVFYAELLAAGLAAKTVRNMHTLLHKALRDAVRKDLVPRNVADAADPPRLAQPGENEMSTWSIDEVRTFFVAIADHPLGVAYTLAVTTGMRRGEILGLRWSDLDLPSRRLTVGHTILSVGYMITEGSPKTVRGRRTIVLDMDTVRLLEQYRAIRPPRARPALARDLVFVRDDGWPVHPDYFSQTFDRTVKRLGLTRIRLHDMRHTHATLGLAAGIPVKIMSERLGHATTAFTQDVYMHSIPVLEEAAADRIGSLLFPTESEPSDPDQEEPHGEESPA